MTASTVTTRQWGAVGMRVAGVGASLPSKVVTNSDLEATLDTSDAWIVERTGIRERRIGGSTTGLAIEAGRAALDDAGADPASIDLVVVATSTPDASLPPTAPAVQDALGLSCGAFDIGAACSGFVYGLATASGMLATGTDRILLIGSETMSRIIDWDDRGTAILFGDGAGALLLDARRDPGRPGALLGYDLGSDGSLTHILRAELGGPVLMDGPEVFRRAVRVVVDTCHRALERAGLTAADVDVFVPHQANLRIIESAAGRLGIPAERAVVVLDHTGNTSAASIPIALAEVVRTDRLHDGDIVLTVGFGAGMSWAAAVLEWAR